MITSIPDPLRRFAPTPYRATVVHRGGAVCIETDDYELTGELAARLHSCANDAMVEAIGVVKIVVEDVRDDGDALVRVEAGNLRMILRGASTLLVYDVESKELLVFHARAVSCAELFERLMPAVVFSEGAERAVGELQRCDNHGIAP